MEEFEIKRVSFMMTLSMYLHGSVDDNANEEFQSLSEFMEESQRAMAEYHGVEMGNAGRSAL